MLCKKGHSFKQRPNAKKGECHECYKQKQREIGQRRYIEAVSYLDAIKLAKGCSVCGYNLHPAALELDHIVPVWNSKRSGSYMTSVTSVIKYMSDPNIQILCANCHRIKTQKDIRSKSRGNN